jgi:hypothetical protein
VFSPRLENAEKRANKLVHRCRVSLFLPKLIFRFLFQILMRYYTIKNIIVNKKYLKISIFFAVD